MYTRPINIYQAIEHKKCYESISYLITGCFYTLWQIEEFFYLYDREITFLYCINENKSRKMKVNFLATSASFLSVVISLTFMLEEKSNNELNRICKLNKVFAIIFITRSFSNLYIIFYVKYYLERIIIQTFHINV